jgi:4-amino-4-deoxy-L-arabinose transferase-like glycosyltransferase
MAMLNLPFFILFGSQAFFVQRVFFIVMSSVANVSLVCAAERLMSKQAAWLVGLLWAIYPPQWFWSTRVNPQTYATNIMVFCLLLLFQAWEKRSGWRAFLIGLLWVTASLCRGEYTLGILGWAAVTFFFAPDKPTRFKLAALLVAGWVVAFAPWVIRNYKIHHRFLIVATNDGYNFWKSYNDEYEFKGEDIAPPAELHARLMQIPNEVDRSDLYKKETMNYIRSHPARTAYIIVGNAFNYWRPWLARSAVSTFQNVVYVVSWSPVFILFLIGLYYLPWRDPAWLAVVALIAYKFFIHIFFYLVVRYRETIFPMIALVAIIPIDRKIREAERV